MIGIRAVHAHAAIAVALLSATGVEGQVPCGDSPPPRPSAPAVPDTVPSMDVYDPLRGDAEALGVGHVSPADEGSLWLWEQRIDLPLLSAPGGPAVAWMVGGWLARPGGSVEPLGWSGFLETGYETTSLVVLEARDDGWLRVRYTAQDDESAWLHSCWLAGGSDPLRFERWGERLLSPDISPLYFVDGAAHAVRGSPSAGAAVVGEIPEGSGYGIVGF